MFEIKDDDKYQWTNHVKEKMAYYRISPSLVKRVIRFPKRTEEGVAPKTIAVMQSRRTSARRNLGGQAPQKNNKPNVEEIWVMYQLSNQKKKDKKENENKLDQILNSNRPKMKIISAWRYPGESPAGKKVPIPDEILQELGSLLD